MATLPQDVAGVVRSFASDPVQNIAVYCPSYEDSAYLWAHIYRAHGVIEVKNYQKGEALEPFRVYTRAALQAFLEDQPWKLTDRYLVVYRGSAPPPKAFPEREDGLFFNAIRTHFRPTLQLLRFIGQAEWDMEQDIAEIPDPFCVGSFAWNLLNQKNEDRACYLRLSLVTLQ
jgi:hypothetical protein